MMRGRLIVDYPLRNDHGLHDAERDLESFHGLLKIIEFGHGCLHGEFRFAF